MAYNEQLTRRIREALENVPHVEEKRMFRGIAFMVNGKMCLSAGDDEIMCRIDPALHDEAIQKDGCRTVIMKGRPYKGYVYVHESVIPASQSLKYWIGLALDFNEKALSSAVERRKGKK